MVSVEAIHVPTFFSSVVNLVVQLNCFLFVFFSDDDSELSDNEKELHSKGEEGLLNGGTDVLPINGSLSRDGGFHLPLILLCILNLKLHHC